MAFSAIVLRKKLDSIGWKSSVVSRILRVVGLKPTHYDKNMELIRSLMLPSTDDGRVQDYS